MLLVVVIIPVLIYIYWYELFLGRLIVGTFICGFSLVLVRFYCYKTIDFFTLDGVKLMWYDCSCKALSPAMVLLT